MMLAMMREPVNKAPREGQTECGEQGRCPVSRGDLGTGDAEILTDRINEDAESVGLSRAADENAEAGDGENDPSIEDTVIQVSEQMIA